MFFLKDECKIYLSQRIDEPDLEATVGRDSDKNGTQGSLIRKEGGVGEAGIRDGEEGRGAEADEI